MNIFQKGIKEGIRFNTSKGMLSTEQMYHLGVTTLTTIIKDLKKQLSKTNDDELSFLDESATPVDATLQLKFDIVKAIYLDKKQERDAKKTAAANKLYNSEIDVIIAKKEGEAKESLTIEQLKALRK